MESGPSSFLQSLAMYHGQVQRIKLLCQLASVDINNIALLTYILPDSLLHWSLVQFKVIFISSSDNGADSIPSNIAPQVNKQMCSEKAVQQTMNSNLDKNSAV